MTHQALIDKEVYAKLWKKIDFTHSSVNGAFKTSQLIEWVEAIQNHQQELIVKQTQKQNKQKEQSPKKKMNEPQSEKKQQANSTSPQKNSKANNKGQKTKPNNDKVPSAKQKQDQQTENSLTPASSEEILGLLTKYSESEQFKSFPKTDSEGSSGTQTAQGNTEKVKSGPGKTQKAGKKGVVVKAKYDDSIISLCYQEAIFFYYWMKNTRRQQFQKAQKEAELELLRGQNTQQQSETNKGGHGQKKDPQTQEKQRPNAIEDDKNRPRFYLQLSPEEQRKVEEKSFKILSCHVEKLNLIFKHYAQVTHSNITKKMSTFSDEEHKSQCMSLHQFMLFGKDWDILIPKSAAKEGWRLGKVPYDQMMQIYQTNSLFRKQMTLQLFMKALVGLSGVMYKHCDINKVWPVNMAINFLSLQDEEHFVLQLKQNGVVYSQTDLFNCFRDKSRSALNKISLVKKEPSALGKVPSVRLFERIPKFQSASQLFSEKQSPSVDPQKQSKKQMYESSKSSLLSFRSQSLGQLSRKTRSSAPNLGVQLPKIDKNRYFEPIDHNNHKNRYNKYLNQQTPESSSVLRNKITGYSKIHKMHVEDQIERDNRIKHEKITQMIGSKLTGIFGAAESHSPTIDNLQHNLEQSQDKAPYNSLDPKNAALSSSQKPQQQTEAPQIKEAEAFRSIIQRDWKNKAEILEKIDDYEVKSDFKNAQQGALKKEDEIDGQKNTSEAAQLRLAEPKVNNPEKEGLENYSLNFSQSAGGAKMNRNGSFNAESQQTHQDLELSFLKEQDNLLSEHLKVEQRNYSQADVSHGYQVSISNRLHQMQKDGGQSRQAAHH